MMERMRDIDWAVVIAVVLTVIVVIALAVAIIGRVEMSHSNIEVLNALSTYNSIKVIIGQ